MTVTVGLFDSEQDAQSCSEMTMPPHTDRRVQRTRELLRSSLFSLIKEKGYDTLSVQEIIDRANVGRATFYAHFSNKDELLLCGFEDLHRELKQLQRQPAVGTPETRLFAFSHHMFAHIGMYRAVYHAMARDRGGAATRQHLHQLIVECSKTELKRLHGGRSGRELDALTQFFAGAFVGLLSWWIEAATPMPVDDIDRLFRRLAVPALLGEAVNR
jgi:AcrR family transcriptional regulator